MSNDKDWRWHPGYGIRPWLWNYMYDQKVSLPRRIIQEIRWRWHLAQERIARGENNE